MSDTPDFDSMSPEEMMKWMESLAVRQGASEGLTTSADMAIDEVDENDERLEGMGEYKPYGMSDEDWAKMQEREAAEKAAKLAEQPQAAAPPPEPVAAVEPEPVAEAEPTAAVGDTPDFDSMSPEELMEWMESLAKRQGADEGFTTSASMEVAEVDASDTRLEGMGEYKPYGMSDDDWAKMQEREAAEKAAKLAARQDTVEDEVVYEDDEELSEYEFDSEEIEPYDYDDEDYVDLDDEEFFETPEDSEDMVLAEFQSLDATQPNEAVLEFADILPEADAEPDIEANPVDWLAGLSGDSDIIEETAPEPVAENPMDWLESLSGGDDANEAPELDFGMDALGDLASLGEASEEGDPMDWLASLSGTDDTSPDLSALAENDQEGSLEWMESLASSEGAESEELITDANLDIPIPTDFLDDGPGYEEFSFEEATGMVNDTTTAPPITTDDELALENPADWLGNLAGDDSDNFDAIFAGEDNELPDDLFDDEAFAASAELEDDEEEFDSLADNVKAQMDSGKLGDSPEDIDKFFASAFAKADQRKDVPDYIDMDEDDDVHEDDVPMPVEAEIPAWLQESMSAAPSAEVDDEPISKTSTGEMMVTDIFPDEEIVEAEIPAWLQEGSEGDSGAIDLDIFEDTVEEAAEAELNISSMDETQDTWVAAFSGENSGNMKEWYQNAVADLEGEDAPAPEIAAEPVVAQAASIDGLQVADLPIESKLAEGSPQNVPTWMMGDLADQSVEIEAVQGDMDWLGDTLTDEDDVDMPDWLKETVDDSVTEGEDLPNWLAGTEDINQDDIPDWLRETMDEEESITEPLLEQVVSTPVAPTPTPLPVPVAQSPAPVPAMDDKIDAVAYLRSAKEKISAQDIDGAMLDYEQVVRANKALGQVEKELQRLTDDKTYKKNPTVNRVLGDVLMRQGKLQEALDTYRKALNML